MIAEFLRSLAEPVVAGAVRDAKAVARAALLRSTIALIAAIAFATGIVFCAWAAYAALAAATSPPVAGIIVGLVLIVAAALTMWWALARSKPEPAAPRVGDTRAAEAEMVAVAAETAQAADRLLRRNATAMAIGALVAGIAAGTMGDRRR